MALKNIQANMECDGCGVPFSVEIEASSEPPSDWNMFDVAVDAVRGSLGYRDREINGCVFGSSVQNDKHLCRRCTAAEDKR